MISRSSLERMIPWIVIVGTVSIWEIGCRIIAVPKYILPSPSLIAISLWEFRAAVALHGLQTLYTTVLGFLLGVTAGMILGVAVGISRLVYSGMYPILIGFNSIPKVAVVPLLVIWFGIGTIPAVITAFLLSFFPILVNVATGLATIEPELEDVLRSLGASKRDILLKVGIPGSLPHFFAALKVSITLALVGSVVSETIASNFGIGYLMVSASSSFNTELVFAGLIVVAFMGIIIYGIFAALEQHLTGWATRKQDYPC